MIRLDSLGGLALVQSVRGAGFADGNGLPTPVSGYEMQNVLLNALCHLWAPRTSRGRRGGRCGGSSALFSLMLSERKFLKGKM